MNWLSLDRHRLPRVPRHPPGLLPPRHRRRGHRRGPRVVLRIQIRRVRLPDPVLDPAQDMIYAQDHRHAARRPTPASRLDVLARLPLRLLRQRLLPGARHRPLPRLGSSAGQLRSLRYVVLPDPALQSRSDDQGGRFSNAMAPPGAPTPVSHTQRGRRVRFLFFIAMGSGLSMWILTSV